MYNNFCNKNLYLFYIIFTKIFNIWKLIYLTFFLLDNNKLIYALDKKVKIKVPLICETEKILI